MKKIKINWGNGLAIGMGCFMLFITIMGVFMFRQTSDEIDHQYYEKGLAYDSVYNQERQVVTDKVQPVVLVDHHTLQISFVEPADGDITFERLADLSLNKVVSFASDGKNHVSIPLDQFRKGRWDLSVAWKNSNKKYLFRQQIKVQ